MLVKLRIIFSCWFPEWRIKLPTFFWNMFSIALFLYFRKHRDAQKTKINICLFSKDEIKFCVSTYIKVMILLRFVGKTFNKLCLFLLNIVENLKIFYSVIQTITTLRKFWKEICNQITQSDSQCRVGLR